MMRMTPQERNIIDRMNARLEALGLSMYQLDTHVGGRWPRRLLLGQVEVSVVSAHNMAELLRTHPANLLRQMVPEVPEPEPHQPWLAVWRPAQARLRAERLNLGLTTPEWGRRAGLEHMSEPGLRRLEYENKGRIPWSRWAAMCAACQLDPVATLYPDAYPDSD